MRTSVPYLDASQLCKCSNQGLTLDCMDSVHNLVNSRQGLLQHIESLVAERPSNTW